MSNEELIEHQQELIKQWCSRAYKDEEYIAVLVKALDFYRTLNNYTYEPGRESNVCKDMGVIAAKALVDTGNQ